MSSRTVSPTDKSFPLELFGQDIDYLDAPLSSFSTPLLALDEAAMEHNIATLAAWSVERGLELMPHGKTTMAPALWQRQLAAGATGITVATAWQADVALRTGVPTVQIANSVTDPNALRRLGAWLGEHPEQELVLWADSPAGIDVLEAHLSGAARVGVLAELGSPGARTGARGSDAALAMAHRVADSPVLTLRGAAGYEGALAHDRSPGSVSAVAAYCDALVALLEQVRPLVDGTPWITAGGSAYFDLVAASLAGAANARRILRSGAYVTHDDGFYHSISPLDGGALEDQAPALRPAMRGYARVVSQPEPGLALLDAGKRDFPFDEGLPVPLAVAPDLGGGESPLSVTVTAMNDQHTFLVWEGEQTVRVGDVVRLGLSHPCTAFDKWRLIPMLDVETSQVTRAVETFF